MLLFLGELDGFSTFSRSRKSVRGYAKDPIPKEVIEEIINTAKWAPSSYNTQAWKVQVLSGDVLDKVREGNVKNTMAGVPFQRDFPYKEEYQDAHKQRQIDVAPIVRGNGYQPRGQRKANGLDPAGHPPV
jgi:nitroreductase